MLKRIRSRLTYANVMSTVAVFVALGGSSYAALSISGKNIKDRSVTGKKLKRNSVGANAVKESSLGPVRRAQTLNGVTGQRFLVSCPEGTFPTSGTCIETVARPAVTATTARLICQDAGGDSTPGRRLPTYGELAAAFSRVDPAPGGELTGHVYPRADGGVDSLAITSKGGGAAIVPGDGSPRAFRCAADPLN